MPLKKPAAAFCTSTTSISQFALPSPYCPPAHLGLTTRSSLPRVFCCSRESKSRPWRSRVRCYATQSSKPSEPSEIFPPWPRVAHPTPYEIFGIQRGAPYTKRRYYQLVKLYHPDTLDRSASGSPTIQQLSNAARLERYHLIVAANDVLSDPHKRHLYDQYGIGWTNGQRQHNLGDSDRAWRQRPGNASRNATWEDWERWRNERSGNRSSEPMFMSNGVFATLVVCMCMIGALAQMNRAEAAGEQYVDFAQQKDSAIGRKMRESTAAASGRTKNERVDCFLRERENLTFEFQPGKFDEPPSSQSNRSR